MATLTRAAVCPPQDLPVHRPDTDIIELADGFHLLLDMPGLEKDTLTIDLTENELTISCKTQLDLCTARHDGATIAHLEFGGGEYRATFTLSDDVDRERIKATIHNGVLDLHLPRSERSAPRRISVQQG